MKGLEISFFVVLLVAVSSSAVEGFTTDRQMSYSSLAKATRVDDAIVVDATSWGAPKIEVKRFHETWEWTYRGRTYNINYRVEGDKDGQPVLLTHGFGANLNHFRYNIKSLVGEGFRVYAMDLLGFGGSEKPANAQSVGFSVELFSQQMVDFIDSRIKENDEGNQKSWVLAGNSIGGEFQFDVPSWFACIQYIKW